MSPPTTDCTASPTTNPMTISTGTAITGFARKLLKPIAMNSFRSTAIRNDGSEYRKKVKNVLTLSSPLY